MGDMVSDDSPLPPPPALRIEENPSPRPSLPSTAPPPTAKRASPATLAARGAPGWERFLGGTSSNITFTSDEARKFRRTKDKTRARAQESGPKSLPHAFEKDGMKPLGAAKSSPSLNEKLDSRLTGGVGSSGPGGGASGQWWKTSMDSLRSGASNGDFRPPECFPPRGLHLESLEEGEGKDVGHSHSNSDSGLSSLSGRTSCMSPLSVISTVSSASSGSSRASLRSASIVSSTTIPLEEYSKTTAIPLEEFDEIPPRRGQGQGGWEEEQEISKLAAELFKLMPVDASISVLFGESSFFKRVGSYQPDQHHILQSADDHPFHCMHPLGKLGRFPILELWQKFEQRQTTSRSAALGWSLQLCLLC